MTKQALGAWVDSPLMQRVLKELVGGADELRLDERFAPELYPPAGAVENEVAWEMLDLAVGLEWFELKYRRNKNCERMERAARGPSVKALPETRARVLEYCRDALCVELHRRLQAWNDAVACHEELNETDRLLLATNPLESWTRGVAPADVIAALLEFRKQPDFHLFQREASARHFWGMSKVVESTPAFFRRWLGVEELPYGQAKVPLLVHLPTRRLSGILFIENLTTWHRACEMANTRAMGMSVSDVFSELALIYSEGKMAIGHIRRGGPALHPASSDVDKRFAASWIARISECLSGEGEQLPVYFWGDLDYEGLAMLHALCEQLPHTRAWYPGYAPMISALRQGIGHAPEAAGKARQVRCSEVSCPVGRDHLLPAIDAAGKFVDQEYVDLNDLRPISAPNP